MVPERLLRWHGENVPNGAIVDYYLKAAPKDEITLEILDSQGKLVRKYSSKPSENERPEQQEWPDQAKPSDLLPAKAGMNRFPWDLRYAKPVLIPGTMWDGGEPPKGPLGVPGKYQVKLTVAGKSETAELELETDPRVKTPQADLEKQLELGLKIRSVITLADETINQIRDVRAQLEALRKRLGSSDQAKGISSAADSISKKMTAVEDALINVNIKATEDSLNYPLRLNNQLSTLAAFLDSADAPPTAQDYDAFEFLNSKVEAQSAAWKETVSKDLAALNEGIRKENIPVISPAAGKEAASGSAQ